MNWRDLPRRYEAFWFALEASAAKLAMFRLAFFALLGLEAFSQISSAPRFGIGDFNVPHFPALLGSLAPDRAVMLVAFALTPSGFRVALGATSKAVIGAVAALWGLSYFASQVDSYQHHYLVFLVAFLCLFLPWQSSGRSVALRLILVQVSLLYAWAAIAKLDPAWLDGSGLARQLAKSPMESVMTTIGPVTMSYVILVTEFFLALALQIRALWMVALPVGVLFHVGIETTRLEIGLFSYVMIAIYLLLLPDRWIEWLAARVPKPSVPKIPVPVAAALAVLMGAGASLLLPFDENWILAIVLSIAGALVAVSTRRIVGHAVACVVILLLSLSTDTVTDYYRFWGGSSRRLGRTQTAIQAYERLTEIRPTYAPAWSSLARLYHSAGDSERARAAREKALKLDPKSE